ncbi:MAG TPA: AAA-like domain-containing protein [Ktedonobacteraceae bacterium]
MPDNPYYDYSVVRDADMFFGRTEILQAIFTTCKQRQCFSLVGTRKIGKSSILSPMQLADQQQHFGVEQDLQRHIFVYIDMRDYLQHTLDDFFDDLCKRIVAQAPEEVSLSQAGDKKHELFTKSLQDLNKAGYHLVLIMDMFDKVADEQQFSSTFFSFLRAPSTKGWVSYITASLKPLHQISPIEAASSPFFGNFKTGYIGALSEEEALQLITVPAQRVGLPFSENETNWIREIAGRHPFFIQVTCHYLFEEKARQGEGNATIDYQKVFQHVYDELAPHFHSIWNELLPEQQRELKQEMRQVSNPRQRLEELSEGSLFQKHISTLLKHVHEKFQVGQQIITVETIREALTKLDDRAFLQSCPLAEWPSINSQSEIAKNSAHRKGLLVQELLKEAFERMKTEGARSDTALEWRLYNILYYRYFLKGRITNEQAAARLGISLRQFYRDQERAIQALLQELLALE